MVDIGQDLTTLYRNNEYRSFLKAIPNTPILRRPDNLYQMVEELTDTRRFPKEIARQARQVLKEL